MSLILNIETSSPVCSVCLTRNGEVVALKESGQEQNHATALTVFIDDVFKQAGLTLKDLSAVAVSAGPGSYTGLRIGASTAKGLCYALDIPLIAHDSLEALAAGFRENEKPQANTLLCPIIDARRAEVYYALYSTAGECLAPSQNAVVDENFLAGYSGQPLHFFGSGANKVQQLAPRTGNNFHNMFMFSARHMAHLSFAALERKIFADVAYFEPNYIKPVYLG